MDTAANPTDAKGKQGAAATSDERHFAPKLPIENNPLFIWPWIWRRIGAYHRDYWLTLSEVSLFLVFAVAGWATLRRCLAICPFCRSI